MRLLAIARAEKGVLESPGEANTPRVLEYLATVGKSSLFRRDETPWCSAFANWVLIQAKATGSGKANARSWLAWGERVEIPFPGCIAVFSRPPNPWSGHVAFFEEQLGALIRVTGGNQGNAVRTSPYTERRLIGYRIPSIATSAKILAAMTPRA